MGLNNVAALTRNLLAASCAYLMGGRTGDQHNRWLTHTPTHTHTHSGCIGAARPLLITQAWHCTVSDGRDTPGGGRAPVVP